MVNGEYAFWTRYFTAYAVALPGVYLAFAVGLILQLRSFGWYDTSSNNNNSAAALGVQRRFSQNKVPHPAVIIF
jgi:hypothetical protein